MDISKSTPILIMNPSIRFTESVNILYSLIQVFKFSLTNNPKLSSEEKRTNEKISNHAKNLEISEWNELWRTIEGTSYTEWESYRDKEFTETQKKDAGLMESEYRKWYDGSDMRGWWD